MWVSPNHPRHAELTAATAPHVTREPPRPSGRELAVFERPGRGRAPDTELRVVLDSYQGHPYISIRLWTKGQDGGWWPTKKGCSIRLGETEGLAEALIAAVRLAQEPGVNA